VKSVVLFLTGAFSVLAVEASILGVLVLSNNNHIASEERLSEQKDLNRSDEYNTQIEQVIEAKKAETEKAKFQAKKAEAEIKTKYGLELTVSPVNDVFGSEICPTQVNSIDPILASNKETGQSYILLHKKTGGYEIFKQEKRYYGPFDTVVSPDKTVVATLDQQFPMIVETEDGYEIHLGDSKRDYRGFQRAYLATKVLPLKTK
jgi:hypothetical protein